MGGAVNSRYNYDPTHGYPWKKREHGKAMTEICVDWEITIWLFNSLPWKDPPFLSSVNHLFPWAIYTMAMLNNQRVTHKSPFITCLATINHY